MNKYKVLGIINFFLGIFGTWFALSFLLKLLPNLKGLHTKFGLSSQNLAPSYLVMASLGVAAAMNVLLGAKNFLGSRENKDKYFKWGIWAIAIIILLSAFSSMVFSLNTIGPLYNLTD